MITIPGRLHVDGIQMNFEEFKEEYIDPIEIPITEDNGYKKTKETSYVRC